MELFHEIGFSSPVSCSLCASSATIRTKEKEEAPPLSIRDWSMDHDHLKISELDSAGSCCSRKRMIRLLGLAFVWCWWERRCWRGMGPCEPVSTHDFFGGELGQSVSSPPHRSPRMEWDWRRAGRMRTPGWLVLGLAGGDWRGKWWAPTHHGFIVCLPW